MNEVRVQMLKFADDTGIIAHDKINLKRALDSLDDILKRNYETEINGIKKQKLWSTPKIQKILI